jgi:type VI secretion system protein ImpL
MASAKDRGEGALAAAGKQAASVVNKLRQAATRQPAPLNRILKSLADDAAGITQGRAVSALNAFWEPGLAVCRATIASRYPIERSGKVEITPADFSRFFGPGGVVDQYFQKYLEPFVDTTRKPWQAKDPQLGLSAAALLEFQRAAEIRDAFFGGAGTTPGARFELKPLVLDEEFERIQLDLDGQSLSYSHGPTRGMAMQWPGPQGSSTARLEFAPSLPDGRSGLTRDGPWNWFRLLDAAELKGSGDPTRFTLTFRLGTRIASFELRAATAINPFNLQSLEKFRCPPRL